MLYRFLGLASVGLIFAIGCATGDSIEDSDGNGGSSSGGSGSGNAGPGGTTGSLSNGSTSGSPTTSSTNPSTTSGPTCSEDPCKLVVPQCGCDGAKACTLDGNNDRVCADAGSIQPGNHCDGSNLCVEGSLCVGYSTDTLACSVFCDSDNLCDGPGGLCVIKLGDGGTGQVPNVTLCSENCDPITATGCKVAGTSCQIGATDEATPRAYTLCTPSGNGIYPDDCTDSSDCSAGYTCVDTTDGGRACFKWCKANSPQCGADQECVAIPLTEGGPPVKIGSDTFGLCNPIQ